MLSERVPLSASELLHFTNAVESLYLPEAVLDALHHVTLPAHVAVLGALLLPPRWEDLSAIELGKTVFLHKSAPRDGGASSSAYAKGPGPAVCRPSCPAPYTMSETTQKLESLAIDRWPFELALEDGMRDILSRPSVAGGWSSTGRATTCRG